jgi:hypothetical protein
MVTEIRSHNSYPSETNVTMSIQKPNIYLSLQADIQNKLKPADWVPFNFNFHSEESEWTFDPSITKEEAFKAITEAGNSLNDFYLRSAKGDAIVFDYITPTAKWMDQVCVKLVSNQGSSCKAIVLCKSTGVFPLSIPFAPILNVFFFWLPFGDNGKNGHENSILRKKVEESSGFKVVSETKRYSTSNPKKGKKA